MFNAVFYGVYEANSASITKQEKSLLQYRPCLLKYRFTVNNINLGTTRKCYNHGTQSSQGNVKM